MKARYIEESLQTLGDWTGTAQRMKNLIAARLMQHSKIKVGPCSGDAPKTLSESGPVYQKRWFELTEEEIQESRPLLDQYFRVTAVLSSKMRSRRSPADLASDKSLAFQLPKIEIVQGMNLWDVGHKLHQWYAAASTRGCDCWWCSSDRCRTARALRQLTTDPPHRFGEVHVSTFRVIHPGSGRAILKGPSRLEHFHKSGLSLCLRLAPADSLDHQRRRISQEGTYAFPNCRRGLSLCIGFRVGRICPNHSAAYAAFPSGVTPEFAWRRCARASWMVYGAKYV
jgi:hypothetical protein